MAKKVETIFLLFSLVSVSVCSEVSALVGESVQLEVKQHPVPEFTTLIWKFNLTNILQFYKPLMHITQYSSYKDRVEFNNGTYSLTLKNLQETDSGPYGAKAVGEKETVVAEHTLTVFDPVEAPVLDHQLSNDTCNITCRGLDLSISSSCDNETCEEINVTSPERYVLSLFMRGNSIICNHSNPVSWNETFEEMDKLKHECFERNVEKDSPGLLLPVLLPVSFIIIIIIIIFIGIIFRHKKSELGDAVDSRDSNGAGVH